MRLAVSACVLSITCGRRMPVTALGDVRCKIDFTPDILFHGTAVLGDLDQTRPFFLSFSLATLLRGLPHHGSGG